MPVTSSTEVLQTRLRELRERHARLEEELADELAATAPDAFHVSLLKKRMQQACDDIADIEGKIYPDIIA